MAELLIKIKDHTNPNPTKDREGAYKKGMIIIVVEDNYLWARMESKQQWIAEGNSVDDWHNKTAILKIPGLAIAKVEELISQQIEDDDGVPIFDVRDRPFTFRRRRWRLLIDSLPASIRNTIIADGEVTTTKAKIRDHLKRIRDNSQYTDAD